MQLLLNSRDPDAGRRFFRDVLEFPFVDAREGWLIFALPPGELGVHPADTNLTQTHAGQNIAAGIVYLMCDDLGKTLDALAAKGVERTEILEAEWGLTTTIRLPGGGSLGLYEPRHRVAIGATRDN